ncbi:MAG: hypothetical protein WC140_06110 [Bacteroidales bacterium]
MKKIIYLMIILASFITITSCEKDIPNAGFDVTLNGDNYAIPKINFTTLTDLKADLENMYSSVEISNSTTDDCLTITNKNPSLDKALFSEATYKYYNHGLDGFIFTYKFKDEVSNAVKNQIIETYNLPENTYLITPLVTTEATE